MSTSTTVDPVNEFLKEKEMECAEALNKTVSFYKSGKSGNWAK